MRFDWRLCSPPPAQRRGGVGRLGGGSADSLTVERAERPPTPPHHAQERAGGGETLARRRIHAHYPALTARGVRAELIAISRSAITASSGIRNSAYSGMSGIRLPKLTMN
jgi:hypothetical protein